MRPGQDPPVAQAGIEYADVLCTAYGVAPGDPQLDLAGAFFGTDLGDARRYCEQHRDEHERSHGLGELSPHPET
jgi:hypothetical protein